jgi:hypothetical protein
MPPLRPNYAGLTPSQVIQIADLLKGSGMDTQQQAHFLTSLLYILLNPGQGS